MTVATRASAFRIDGNKGDYRTRCFEISHIDIDDAIIVQTPQTIHPTSCALKWISPLLKKGVGSCGSVSVTGQPVEV